MNTQFKKPVREWTDNELLLGEGAINAERRRRDKYEQVPLCQCYKCCHGGQCDNAKRGLVR